MNPWIVLPAIVALGIVYVMLPISLETFSRYHRRKVLHCPEVGDEVWVLIDARRAGISAAFGHLPSCPQLFAVAGAVRVRTRLPPAPRQADARPS